MSNDSTTPLKQLLELIPGADEPAVQSSFESFVADGGSVFDLLKLGRQQVVETFGLHSRTAQLLMDRAQSLAVYTAREFREQRLVTQAPRNLLHRTGVQALVADAPTFDDLFEPDWEGASPSQSPDSSISPASYFVRLIMLARDLERRAAGATGLITLDTRRPDLDDLVIDSVSMFQIKPTVTLVNEVLESIIKKFIENNSTPANADDKVVDDRLLETRFPFRSMPFEWYAEQWKQVLQENKLSLGEVTRAIDLTAPYFKQTGVHGNLSDIALRQSCNIGPQGQRILLENFLFSSTADSEKLEAFYKRDFGSTGEALTDSVHFCAQTSIDAQTLTSFLSIEDCVPSLTKNVAAGVMAPASPKVFGSVFINDGDTEAMGLTVPANGTRKFSGSTHNRFERMSRMLRLSRWLKLPPDQSDRLVIAAIRAEQRSDLIDSRVSGQPFAATPLKITNNTLRAIGLFQEFRLQFKCSAEQFAALIDEISPYGRGEEPSQFDRIFNARALFDTPLRVDNAPFAIDPQTRADKRTIDHICSSLGINQEAWRYLARFVAKSHNLTDELTCSLPVLSSLYRHVLLASFLRISAIELGALLEALSDKGGSELLQRVLGESRLRVSGASSNGDLLSVMHAVQSCVLWCQDNELSVSWLVQHVTPVIAPPMATEADTTLLQELHKRLQPARLSEEALRAAGVPANNNNHNYSGWLQLLEEVVDLDGLVLSLTGETNDYERLARAEIEAAVTLAEVPQAEVVRTCEVILALLLQARDAQSAVVQESLSVYLSLSQDLVLPLLSWVDKGGVYLLLLETTRALEAVTSGSDKVNVGDEVLNLLAHLLRRADVVQKLGLSSAMLVALTTRQNWQWLGLRHPQELSLGSLYYLTLFQRMVINTGQPAEKLLHYLELVNALPTYLTPEDLRLIRDSAASKLAEVVKWGVREVLECILYLNPAMPVVRDLVTLDTLIRIRGLAASSGLDAKAIIGLGSLTPDSDKSACRSAAEHVVECLSESAVQGESKTFGEIGQSVTHDIRCINDTLIANKTGEVALIELTLRDLTNKVLPNITVTWSSDRPGLMESASVTDHEGRAVIRFKAEKGPWMGAVQVKGTYGLDQTVYAPKILIDCDEFTLGFSLDSTGDPGKDVTFLAGGQAFFPVSVRLVDSRGNPGRGRTVTFAGKGVVADPLVVMTDEKGVAQTKVRSMEAVEKASLVASYSNKDSLVINNITFVDKPSIKHLEAASVAVVERPLILSCLVVGLNKKPFAGAKVEFFQGETRLGEDTTSAEGIAQFTVTTPTAGDQVFIAKVEMGEQRLNVYVAKAAVIHGESTDYLYPVAGSGTPTLLWVAVREEANNQSRLIANCPIEWTVKKDDGSPTTVDVASDALGRSTFPFEADAVGNYVVTATLKGTTGQTREFDLKVVPAIEWTYKLTGGGTEITQAPLAFIRGKTYTLEIDLPPSVNLTDARAMLAWTGEFSAKGLGMIFNPPTGAYVTIGASTKLSWAIDCKDLRNGAFDLTFYCNRLDQRLVLAGRLDAPPPVLSSPAAGEEIEVQPWLIGTGSSSAQIYVFAGREGPLLARTSVGDDGKWAVRISEPLSLGPHVISVKQRHIDTTEAWAADVRVTVKP